MATTKEAPKSTIPASEAFISVRVTPMEKESLRGLASVQVGGLFWITGIRVVQGSKGLFVSMPSRKTSSGEHKDVAFPASKELRDQLQSQVMEAYNAAVTKKHEALAA